MSEPGMTEDELIAAVGGEAWNKLSAELAAGLAKELRAGVEAMLREAFRAGAESEKLRAMKEAIDRVKETIR